MAGDDQEKTEEATPERRRKAREEGQFPRGKDAGNTLGSLAVLGLLIGGSDLFRRALGEFTHRCLTQPTFLLSDSGVTLGQMLSKTLLVMLYPVAGAAALGALAAGLAEAGYQPKIELAFPKWSRLEPLGKLKQMFSPQQGAVNVSLQLGRVAAVGIVAYTCVATEFPRLLRLARVDISLAAVELAAAVVNLALWASAALSILVIVDYLYNRWRHEKQIMMSQHEVKEEHKQQEGDPRVRAQQRARAREIAKKSILQAVENSDFVIANPTHVSVAVRYRPEEGAPVVTAKGYDEIALHIRELAKKNDLPIIRDIPLARALAKRVRVGKQIPVDLYAAVAEVLALVYRLKNRGLSV